MEVRHENQGAVDILHVSGQLDYTATAGNFDEKIRAPWSTNPVRRFPVLDLSEVTMMSSQALRAILALAKDLQGPGGKVFVAAPSASALEALKTSGFMDLKIFEMHATLPEAITAATLAARKAPPLQTDPGDPWKMPEEVPPPPEPPKGMEAFMINAGKIATALGKGWQSAAMSIQSLLDKKPKK